MKGQCRKKPEEGNDGMCPGRASLQKKPACEAFIRHAGKGYDFTVGQTYQVSA